MIVKTCSDLVLESAVLCGTLSSTLAFLTYELIFAIINCEYNLAVFRSVAYEIVENVLFLD